MMLRFKTPSTETAGRPFARSAGPSQAPAQAVPTEPPPESSTPSATPSPAGPLYKDGQFTGADVSMRFGDVQVKVIVSGHHITDIQELQMPFDRPRSQYISQQAGPYLREEVLQAQSTAIDTISGATYTSDAYAQSVQSALDRARS